MSMKINYNSSAIIANNSLKMNDKKLTISLERLSSGYKINSAKDNAAGLAISRRMNAQIKGLKVASQDAKDGTSVIEIADGALSEVHDILQRMNELAVKAANGTLNDEDREACQQEIDSLAEEIDRIGETTEYNGQQLFTGKFDYKGYTTDKGIKVDYYSDYVDTGVYKLSLNKIEFELNADGDYEVKSVDGNTACEINITNPNGKTERLTVSGDPYHLILKGDSGDEIKLDTSAKYNDYLQSGGNKTDSKVSIDMGKDLELELKGYGAMTIQVGANEGQDIDIRFPKMSLETLGFKNQDSDSTKDMKLSVATETGARKSIELISKGISFISDMRSKLGAYQNRLEHTQNNLATSEENVTSAYSRIMDTDMAEEMTEYSNLQVINQAATAILAQANERPSQMLQLLQ